MGWVSSGITNKIFMLCCETVSSLINQRKKIHLFQWKKSWHWHTHNKTLNIVVFGRRERNKYFDLSYALFWRVYKLRVFCWKRGHTKQFPNMWTLSMCTAPVKIHKLHRFAILKKVCPLRLSTLSISVVLHMKDCENCGDLFYCVTGS